MGKKDAESGSCPFKIVLHGAAVMDNDDFNYDFIGSQYISSYCYVGAARKSRAHFENHHPVLVNQKDLKILSDQENKVQPAKTIKKGVPLVWKSFNRVPETTKPMQVEQIIHFILQIDKEYEPISPEERTIASIARFQPRIQSKPQKSKSHYFLTLPPLLINLKYMK